MFILLLSACDTEVKNDVSTNTVENLKPAPTFNEENAYQYVVEQCKIGPRYPGSPGQKKCADFISAELKKYCDTVFIQNTIVSQPISNKKYPCINIIGAINPQAPYRILLLCHWDSRPWADQDSTKKEQAIIAADDGASGVAVLLEIAKAIKEANQKPENVGIDLLFVDAEDVGKTEWGELSYCLGTQYWAKNPHVVAYKAAYGICLDMVGAQGATFPLEANSKQYAPEVQENVWKIGNQLGYSNYFLYQNVYGGITDDHLVVNTNANIPTIDIINYHPEKGFANHWHTHQDDIHIIDKKTLKAVGQTVLQVIYQE